VVRGVSTEVRTFTASPFVFASLKSARRFDQRYRDDEVTYVLAKCAPGHTPEQVRDAVAHEVPNVEVLTRGEFVLRTILYWMLETGVGITVTLTGILGFLVSAVVVSQTLYTITQDHLTNYATLLAVGFSRRKLSGIVFLQSLILGGVSWSLGSLAFHYAAQASAPTAVPLEMTWWVWDGVTAFYFATCVAASFLSLKSVLQLDPAVVFRG
jgi:putative ABC transport system permease protein